MKLCIVLQYYGGDYFRAMELARFIAQLEPHRRRDVHFLFFGRWDAGKPDPTTMQLVGEKFGVTAAASTKWKWTGWPAGPNGIAREVLETAPNWLAYAGCHDVDALLMLEPDCVPFAKDWLEQLIEEWETFGMGTVSKWQIGAWRGSGGPEGHINGNCLIRADIRRVLPLQVITPHLAWDCAIAPLMRDHWYDSWLFRNDFQGTNAELERLLRPRRGARSPVLIHGYKDDSALKLARTILL